MFIIIQVNLPVMLTVGLLRIGGGHCFEMYISIHVTLSLFTGRRDYDLILSSGMCKEEHNESQCL